MTSQYSPDRQPGTLEKAVFPESLQGVCGAGGGETAGGRLQRRYADLVETDEYDEGEDGYLPEYLHNTFHCPDLRVIHGY